MLRDRKCLAVAVGGSRRRPALRVVGAKPWEEIAAAIGKASLSGPSSVEHALRGVENVVFEVVGGNSSQSDQTGNYSSYNMKTGLPT